MASAQLLQSDPSSLEEYLKQVSFEDLLLLKQEKKSSKKLEGGPMVSGVKSPNGQIKKGYSIPANAREDKSLVYGASSYHGGDFVALKDLLQNKYLKETLIQKIQNDITSDMIDKHVAEPRDWRNKAFECRKNSATQKIQELEANHWTNNSPLKS